MFLHLKRNSKGPHAWDNLSDEALVNRYLQTGDKELIAVLFERYTHLVYGICLKYLQDSDHCKDAVMEIFEGLFHKLTVHQVMNFRNWIYSVARNHCLMALRKSDSYCKTKDRIAEAENAFEAPVYMEEEELLFPRGLISSAVEKLNPEQGTCIRLMYLDDKSYHDISVITGYSMNEVKSHIQNGKRNLKNLLLKKNGNTDS
jgi:RNA polymerase sigma factor (sigma-70 family)